MFLENKYSRWYFALIEKAKKRNTNFDERHHIIPKSLDGSNDDTNLVGLTYREHYIAHMFLIRMTVGTNRSKMAYALFRFGKFKSKNYALYKKTLSKNMLGENNPFFGKKHSEKTRAQIKANHGLAGKGLYLNWVEKYGKDEADRRNISYKNNLSASLKGRPATLSTLGTKAVYKNGQRKMITSDSVQEALADGWNFHRPKLCPYCEIKKLKWGAKSCRKCMKLIPKQIKIST